LRNAQINNGVADFMLTENDLVVEETQFKSQMSTVLMIDISHSMICTAKIELHLPKSSHGSSGVNYNSLPKRYVRYFGFGNDAWTIAIEIYHI
jgi:hypothetical protein